MSLLLNVDGSGFRVGVRKKEDTIFGLKFKDRMYINIEFIRCLNFSL